MSGPPTISGKPDPVRLGRAQAVRRDTEDIFAAESAVGLRKSTGSLALPSQLGQYQILRPLGKGGMARVFLAEHVNMKRRVAIKVLPEELARNRAALERFYREARTAAALDHPNIVRAYDVREADGLYFLVMEYVDGQDLEAIMNARSVIAIRDAVDWTIAVAHGLEHAAAKNIVHRDIKPSNLLLDKHGTIKILDMGLARFRDQQEDRVTDKFDSGAVMCTPDYVAPEQILRSEQIDVRTDIYSLGATLYALLAGRPPFEGSVTMKLVSHQAREAIPLRQLRTDIPPELSRIVARMMAKNPDQRYRSPADVIEALKPWSTPPATTPPCNMVPIDADTVPPSEWSEFMNAVEADHTPNTRALQHDRRQAYVLATVALLPMLLILFFMLRQVLRFLGT